MNLLTKPMLYGLTLAVLAAGVALGVQTLRLASANTAVANEKAAHAKTKADHADVLRDLAEKTAAVVAAVRAREAQYGQDSAAARESYEKDKANALSKKDRVIADLRSGNERLRQHWTCLVPAAPGSVASTAPGGADDAADLRAAGAGDLVRILAGADAQVTWLQAELLATRKVCGAEP